MSVAIKINGGKSLKGTVVPVSNKNSILKLIPATLLCDEPVVFKNVSISSSFLTLVEIYEHLGGRVEFLEPGVVKFDSSSVNNYVIPEELARKERAALVFLGPLLAKFGKAQVYSPGGCKLGNRPLDTLFQGLIELGARLDQNRTDSYFFEAPNGLLPQRDTIWLMEASVTGTENLILAAVKCKGNVKIYHAACEPHTQDLCNFLNSVGAKISGVGSNLLSIQGVDHLKGGEWSVISDHIDIGGWIVAAAITNGELLIRNAIPQHIMQILNYFSKLNLYVEVRGNDIYVPSGQDLFCKKNINNNIDKIQAQVWPGFPVDLIPQALVLALTAKGSIIIFSNLYESQLFFVEELQKMGASFVMPSTYQIITFGPSNWHGATISAPQILQCTHATILAALAARGQTIINNADSIFRRYPDIIKKLQDLGVDIELIKD